MAGKSEGGLPPLPRNAITSGWGIPKTSFWERGRSAHHGFVSPVLWRGASRLHTFPANDDHIPRVRLPLGGRIVTNAGNYMIAIRGRLVEGGS